MDSLYGFLLLVLVIVVLAKLSGIKGTLKNIESEQGNLRRMIKKLLPEEESGPTVKPWTPPPRQEIKPPAPAPATPAFPVQPPPVPAEPAKPAPATPMPTYVPYPRRPEPKPSKVGEILKKIWSWILVGEEHRREGVSAEFAIASTWLVRAGIIVLVTSIGFFLKWSIEKQLLGPTGRTAIAIAAGIGMLAAGYRLFGKKYHLMGQGLFGGGLAALYFSMYAAGPRYGLIPIPMAFLLMILITITAGLLSVRVNSLLVAILGIIGGFCTPIMLSTGKPDFMVLYTYMLILGAGVFALSQVKAWRLLNYLSFLFTWMLVLGSLFQYRDSYFNVVITLLSLLFALHAAIVIWHNIGRNGKLTVLEIIYLLVNSGIFSLVAYGLIRSTHGRPYPSILTLSLAVFFIAHVLAFLQFKRGDRNLLITMMALAGFYTTLTMPLVLERESLTMSWSLLALMFLWLSGKVQSRFLNRLSYLLYGLVFIKLAAVDLHENFPHPSAGATGTFKAYLDSMKDRLWTFGVSIASVFGAFWLERKRPRPAPDAEPLETSPRGLLPTLFYWIGLSVLLIYALFETNAFFRFYAPWRLPMMTVVFCMMGIYTLWRFFTTNDRSHLIASNILLGLAAVKLLLWDIPHWEISHYGLYGCEYSSVIVLSRLLDFGLLLVILFGVWALFIRRDNRKSLAPFYGYGGLALLFLYTTLELNAFLYVKEPSFRAGGVSVLWAVYAVCYVAGGIWKKLRGLRLAGLLLFAIATAKVFLHDLAGMPAIWRVAAFFVVGVTLLIGAFAYLKAAPGFIQKKED